MRRLLRSAVLFCLITGTGCDLLESSGPDIAVYTSGAEYAVGEHVEVRIRNISRSDQTVHWGCAMDTELLTDEGWRTAPIYCMGYFSTPRELDPGEAISVMVRTYEAGTFRVVVLLGDPSDGKEDESFPSNTFDVKGAGAE